jgi:hypothetical protein
MENVKSEVISQVRENKLSGPMGPMLASKELLKHLEIRPGTMTELHRIWFDDEHIYNRWDGKPDRSYYDHLIIKLNGGVKLFFIDMGCDILPGILIDGNESIITPVFKKYDFIKRPDEKEFIEFIKAI